MSSTREKASFRFPLSFWTANSIELLERAAYYSMASFMVIYLKETLGMSPTMATFLNGTLLWGLIFFLPIVSGTLADQFGFRRSLLFSFVLLFLGYFMMGQIPRFWPALRRGETSLDYTLPAVLGVLLIGVGGSFVKPCVAGTVQKTSGVRTTLGFGIFYMVINIGSICGRAVSYFIRTHHGIPAIFTLAATPFILLGLLVVIFLFREPTYATPEQSTSSVPKRTLGQALLGIFVVLSNLRFVFFLIVIGLFWFLYVQLYNLMPLYLRHIDPNAPVELYTLANPIMIVCFQMAITHLVKKWRPVASIILGVSVTTAGMLLNLIPPLILSDLAARTSFLGVGIPVAGIFLIISIASMAVGEMMASPRTYEYIGAIAPRGQEGLYLGYANLPIALGSMVGGPVGGALFSRYMAAPLKAGMNPKPLIMWAIVAAVGLASIIGVAIYDRLLGRQRKL